MTIDRTLAPPKEAPWFKCSNHPECTNLWQAYHGKVGCLCYECDDKTPDYVKRKYFGEKNHGYNQTI
ncbi:hypothetical protein LD36_gp54 [Vibrio phage ICP2_2013_A_Haiti]|uniref:hypothetical protein n=1 Tax=Vibrio phage ICP2_2013_A_Haiti TaxID=1529058 RepID=UPI0004E5CAE4|nr:hypothetical protein LD36_gp54 [Vibrio phage ICP2_2013_A_Haiti]AII27168.1 hypothetical protein ICP22013AHaiti_54 [Vibrio phage ICP2_2013_A_Haiti]